MRWPNGGPPRLYAAIDNETGALEVFARLKERSNWLAHGTPWANYTLLTYVQKEKVTRE